MKKRLLTFVLAFAMVASCVACGGSKKNTKASDSSSEAEEEIVNTVVVAMGGGFSTLDPGYVYEKYPAVAIIACYETLFKFYGDKLVFRCYNIYNYIL